MNGEAPICIDSFEVRSMKKGMAGAVILGMLLLILDSGRALRGAS